MIITDNLKTRARIIQHLGDELIRNEKIAVIELVKNSYDADASNVVVEFNDIEDIEKTSIIISDNGYGMSGEIIRNVWFEIGTAYKKNKFNKRELTPKFKRLPIGEKGIGRFSVHKLGNEIELITKEIDGENETYFKIDWTDFDEDKYLLDIKIDIVNRSLNFFKNSREHGTVIIIKKLKNEWTRGMVRDLYRSLTSMVNPFEPNRNFKVELIVDKDEWIEDLLSWEDIISLKLFYFKIIMENDDVIDFEYKFTPWKTMDKIPERLLSFEDLKTKKMTKEEKITKKIISKSINLGIYNIGRISFEGILFDRDKSVLSIAEIQARQGLIDYLKVNSGIKVFRNNLRIYNYGEPGNDWLGLDSKRVNLPGERLSNNLIIGNINLERENSSDLIEKTNREGFIENNAYITFVDAIEYAIRIITNQRNIDKDKIRKYYGTDYKKEPILSDLADLKFKIETEVKDQKLRNEVFRYINRIEKNYEAIQKSFVKFAGSGFGLSMAIHEIEKSIKAINAQIENEEISNNLITLIKRLSDITERFTIFVQKFKVQRNSIERLVDDSIFYIKARIKKHKIEIIENYKKRDINSDLIEIDKSLTLTAILNLIDNSIWWLNYKEKSYKFDKKILIDFKITEKTLSIIIADNGLGFALPTEEIVKPFVSAKDDGMGLGLFLVSRIMELHGGELIFPNPEIVNVPKEFLNGAIVELMFRRN